MDGCINDHPLEFAGPHGLDGHSRVDGGLEQFLDAGLADGAAESADLRGAAGRARLEILLAAEELKVEVLAPALDDGLVALVVGVVQIQQLI